MGDKGRNKRDERGGGGRTKFLGKLNKRGFGILRKKRGKRFKVEHKGSSKLGITMLCQAGQVQCDNGPTNIPVRQSH